METRTQKDRLMEVIELLARGAWEEAHPIVQADKSAEAAWLHRIVHTIEAISRTRSTGIARRSAHSLAPTRFKRRSWPRASCSAEGHRLPAPCPGLTRCTSSLEASPRADGLECCRLWVSVVGS
jgi:hypothetical protein